MSASPLKQDRRASFGVRVYVTTAELFSLWRVIGETSGDPGIGLKLGCME